MTRLGKLILAIAIVCIIKESHAGSQSSNSRNWSLSPNGEKFFKPGTLFINDASIYPFGTCENTVPRKEITCAVTVIQPFKKDRVCSGVKVVASGDKEIFLGGFFQLIPFNENHVLVVYYEASKEPENIVDKKYNLAFSILNVNTCETFHKSFPVDQVDYDFFPSLVFYQDQLDLILTSKAECNGEKICKLTFDLEGKQIGGTKPYLAGISQYAAPVLAADPRKGFFMTSNNLKTLKTLLVNDAGEGKMLKTENFNSDATKQFVVFSNAQELFTVCNMPVEKSATKVYCSQFNGGGKTIIDNVAVPLEKSAEWIAVRSLRDGGFLLGTSNCGKNESQTIRIPNFFGFPIIFKDQSFNVFNVQKDGQITKQSGWNGPEFQCNNNDSGLEVRLSENERNQFCFDFSYQKSNTTLSYYTYCKSDE